MAAKIIKRAKWVQAVQWHDDLRHWLRSEPGMRVSREWFLNRLTPTQHKNWPENPTSAAFANAKVQAETASSAVLYWISDEMLTVAIHAAQTMPDQVFLETDVPAPFGLIVFQTAQQGTTINGKKVMVQGYLWGNNSKTAIISESPELSTRGNLVGATHMDLLTNTDLDQGYLGMKIDLKVSLPTLVPFWAEVFRWGAPVLEPERHKRFRAKAASPLALSDCILWQRKLPKALWTLIQQPLAVVSEVPIPRAYRRRAERVHDEVVPTIRLVDLRRLHHETSDGEIVEVEWSHRWLVSGHWRWQPFGPARGEHRWVWINSYVKGPEDKPLVVKKTVNRLVR